MENEREKRCLVLLVDDETRSARVLAKMLREDGYDVELVFDAPEAIARLAREPLPDILLTDFRLSHADGIVIAEYARSRRASMPVLMLTGYAEIAGRLLERLEPPAAILPKPLDYAEVIKELARRRAACPCEDVPKTASTVR